MAKKGRKSNGEGSIIQLKNGLWQARISIRNPEGELKRVAFYGKTKKEAHEKLVKAQRETQTGSFVEPNKELFETWITSWLDNYKKGKIKPASYALYEMVIRTHISPAIGKISIQKVETKDIQKLLNSLAETKKSTSLIEIANLLIKGALNQAMKEQKVMRNVASAVELPKGTKKEVYPLSQDDVKKFLQAAKKSKYYPAFLLEINTGLRKGELLALRWRDINLDEGTIQVNETLSRVSLVNPKGEKKTELVFGTPKTKKSNRVIKVPANALKVLKEHQLASGNRNNPDGLVFSVNGGKPLDPKSFTERYAVVLKKAGIPKTCFHALRHTAAVMLLQAGETVKNVQDLLGHEKYSTTMDTYAAYMPDSEKAKTADRMDSVIGALI